MVPSYEVYDSKARVMRNHRHRESRYSTVVCAKMASIVLCLRLEKEISRQQFTDIDLSQTIESLKQKVANETNFRPNDLDFIYCGQNLQNDKSLHNYGIKTGSTVYVLQRKKSDVQHTAAPLESGEMQQVVTALQTALLNPSYRNMVQEMLHNPSTLESIVAATPSLESDPVAFAMLQTPELLAILADPHYIHRVLEKHPSLGHAAMYIASAVHEEGSRLPPSNAPPRRETYSLDQMSDDEELVGGHPGGIGSSTAAGNSSQPITTSQLAAALAIAGGSSQPPPPLRGPQQQQQEQPGSSGGITADLFQQAMMQAASPQGEAQSPTSNNSTQPALQSQLEQLRGMGITDEVAARHALEATGGDINAALQILFGDAME